MLPDFHKLLLLPSKLSLCLFFLLFSELTPAETAQIHFEKAVSFLKGQGEQQSYFRAIDHFREAHRLKHPDAVTRLNALHYHLLNEPSLKVRYRRALNLAKQGDMNAQYELGQMCEYGLGVAADFERAKAWYEKAAEQNHSAAQNRLATFYTQAFINASKAGASQANSSEVTSAKDLMQWLKIAAENDQAEAQLSLANFYYQGDIFEQDFEKAFYWYRRAAENGNAEAQLRAGLMLKNGEGTRQNYELALLWLEKSLQQGHELARPHVVSVNEILDDIFLKNFK